MSYHHLSACAILSVLLSPWATAQQITTPPDSFFERVRDNDRTAAQEFYRKYVNIGGVPAVAGEVVSDEALLRTYEIVDRMLAGRPDIRKAMDEGDFYLIVIGKDQLYTDMPEYRNSRNKDYLNERVRGTGGRVTSFGEENVLCLPHDRYDDESICVHEFCHTIDRALRSIDPRWTEQRNSAYENAMEKGLYKLAYTAGNPAEYWAEIAQTYFDSQRVNNWNHGPIGTREQLKVYDPQGYELCRQTFNLTPETDWRYKWLQTLPNIIPPPEKLGYDGFYTKMTYAREFPVLGNKASNQALLKANDTIRKMFAYRHDILKALINDGVRLVVLSQDEKLSDLPELQPYLSESRFDLLARSLEYAPEIKLLVVGEENVMSNPRLPLVGGQEIIRVFANAILQVPGQRPVDPDWTDRRRNVQQYELRVDRVDTQFVDQLTQLFEQSVAAGKWRGTSAIHSPGALFAAGLLAYFDAAGQEAAPNDASHPIVSREQLREYDPSLYEFVHKAMAYDGHFDWRFHPED